jgi:hypothetical protein
VNYECFSGYKLYISLVYSGLIGPLLVCKKGTLDSEGRQKNVNKEYILMFTVSNENEAWYIEKNVKEFIGASAANSYEYGKNMQLYNGLFKKYNIIQHRTTLFNIVKHPSPSNRIQFCSKSSNIVSLE